MDYESTALTAELRARNLDNRQFPPYFTSGNTILQQDYTKTALYAP
jgi:hypothetical protein